MLKQTSIAFLALLGLNGAAQAQTPGSCAPPSLANTGDLKPVPESNLMTVPVQINGASKRLLLDVGTAPDEISQAAVSELNLAQVDRNTNSNVMAEQSSLLQFQPPFVDVRGTTGNYQSRVRIATFTIGGATLHDLLFLVSTDRDMGKSKPYDGRLTTSGFQKYDMNFDFGGKKLSFLAPTSCADPAQIATWPHAAVAVIPMTISNNKISVPVTIDGHPINAVIDTGSDHTVMSRGIAERVFGLKADTPDMMADGDVRDGSGQRVYQHTFPHIAFEGVVASNVPALIQVNSMVRRVRSAPATGSRLQAAADPGDPVPDLALGMDMLHQLHIYAAFGQGKLYVTPAG